MKGRRGVGSGSIWVLCVVAGLLVGCEAKLRLAAVEEAGREPIRRSDQYQAAVAAPDRLVVVGTHGVVLTSTHGDSWTRQDLPGWPSLIDLARCPDGTWVALAFEREVWTAAPDAARWTRVPLADGETPQAITCDPQGRWWIAGGFSSLQWTADGGRNWNTHTLDEDLFLTSVQFVDAMTAYATGEFGTVICSRDGGATWERLESLPDEFYPQDAWFADAQRGWIVGLRGGILATEDGGDSWSRQASPTLAPLYGLGIVDGIPQAVGGEGVVLRLQDGHWQRIDYADPVHGFLRAIAPAPGGRVLVAGGGGALRLIPAGATRALASAP